MNKFDEIVEQVLNEDENLVEKNFLKKLAATALATALPYTAQGQGLPQQHQPKNLSDIISASHGRLIDDVIRKSKERTHTPIQKHHIKSTRKTNHRAESMPPEEIIARTLYGEARGESFLGKKAVASVIYNRAKGNPDKMTDVVLAPKQFSIWNDNNIAPKGDSDDPTWQECLKLAKQLLSGEFDPVNSKWTHYYNPQKARPNWAHKGTALASIGRHKFMRVESVEGFDLIEYDV